MATKSTHRHRTIGTTTRCYTGPVRSPENRAAHGNVCHVDRCLCGAERLTNVNGPHVEQSEWSGAVDERADR
jgi:hypothetical protein